jgi:transglutaminase-like putative cysteine protease
MSYRGEFGNRVHHFAIPNSHSQLTIIMEALVDMLAPSACPEELPTSAWGELDEQTARDDYWDTLMPSQFARESSLLTELARELHVERSADPLTVLRSLNTAIYQTFDYSPRTTRVDSPIDEALHMRKGVCQDFAHIMIALVRRLRIPCRYVSGYLCQQGRGMERVPDSAMHAWVEAYLPGLDWVGFDPTNNTLADERHIRVAIGRDYADVSPTRGVFRGRAESELSVSVRVIPSQNTLTRELPAESSWTSLAGADEEDEEGKLRLAQQQQQQ